MRYLYFAMIAVGFFVLLVVVYSAQYHFTLWLLRDKTKPAKDTTNPQRYDKTYNPYEEKQ